jgi:hypothetical protein
MIKRVATDLFVGWLLAAFPIAARSQEPPAQPQGLLMSDEQNHEKSAEKTAPYAWGAQVRLRGELVTNQHLADFNFSPGTHEVQLLSRTRLHLLARPAQQMTVLLQGQFYTRHGAHDLARLNLYQASLELADPDELPIRIKVGRQELTYGSAFSLGANDFYDGLTWDGVKLRYEPSHRFWLDLIGARFVRLERNLSEREPALYGAYAGWAPSSGATAETYILYHQGGFRFFHTDMPDSPRWFTLGARMAGRMGRRVDYEIEPVYQFGRIENPDRVGRDRIRAYGGHLEGGYTVDPPRHGRLFAAYAFGSGDQDSSDTVYREFHGNIYHDTYLVGDTSLIPDLSGVTVGSHRASGMHVFTTGCSIDLNPKLNLNADYHHLVAGQTPPGISRTLGSEANLIVTYRVSDTVTLVGSINRFFTGRFFRDAAGAGSDVTYAYVQMQLEF